MSNPYPSNEPGRPVPYGQPYPPVAVEHPQGNTVLILGIVGFFVPIVSFVAWYLGSKVLKEMRASGQTYSNEQYVTIGRILGIIWSIVQLVSLVAGIIGIIIWFVFFAAVVANSGG